MHDPWAHLERNFVARMKRDQPAHDERDRDPPVPTPRCDRTRDMFDERAD